MLTAVALAIGAVGAGPAHAQGEIASEPLTISSSDANELQVRFTSSGLGEFDPPDGPFGQFGLMVETPDALYGFAGDKYELVGDHVRDQVSGQERMTSVYHVTLPGAWRPPWR